MTMKYCDYIDTILDNVNLDAYSDSPGWMGYYNKDRYYKRNIMPLLNGLEKSNIFDVKHSIMVTSLFYEKLLDSNIGDDLYNISDANRIRRNNIISGDGYRNFVDVYEHGKQKNDYEIESRRFRIVKEKQWSGIKKNLFLWFDFEFTIPGHCFLVSMDKKMIIYPHCDDFGFGIIVCEKDNTGGLLSRLQNYNIANGFVFKAKPEKNMAFP